MELVKVILSVDNICPEEGVIITGRATKLKDADDIGLLLYPLLILMAVTVALEESVKGTA